MSSSLLCCASVLEPILPFVFSCTYLYFTPSFHQFQVLDKILTLDAVDVGLIAMSSNVASHIYVP